jgi:hypothetical protein
MDEQVIAEPDKEEGQTAHRQVQHVSVWQLGACCSSTKRQSQHLLSLDDEANDVR